MYKISWPLEDSLTHSLQDTFKQNQQLDRDASQLNEKRVIGVNFVYIQNTETSVLRIYAFKF